MPNPIEWSKEMENLFWSNIAELVRDDLRTDWSENLSLGYPFEVIREQVLAKGLADFGKDYDHPEYGHLSADDKVLLYSFVNLKKHFFAALATFEVHRSMLEDLFAQDEQLTVIDIGCGPGTACLALADLFPGKEFAYVGIDSAEPMRSKAKALWSAAQGKGLIGKKSVATFQSSWADFAESPLDTSNSILVILCYCCASHTLTLPALHSMAHTVRKLADDRIDKPLVLVYLNSTNPQANVRYEVFKEAMGLDPEQSSLTKLTVEYRKKRGGPIGQEEFVHEVLRLRRK